MGFRLLFFLLALGTLALHGAHSVVRVPSALLSRAISVTVITPSRPAPPSGQEPRPVVFLLHGYSGDHRTLADWLPLQNLADTYDVLFIAPDGLNLWYLDSPVDSTQRYASFFFVELLPWLEQHLNITQDPKRRFLAGSSMGGHGALHLLSQQPQGFAGALSLSGVLELSRYRGRFGLSTELVGDEKSPAWDTLSFMHRMGRLQEGPPVILISGRSDFAHGEHLRAAGEMQRRGIRHSALIYPGGHTPEFVIQHFAEGLRLLLAAGKP